MTTLADIIESQRANLDNILADAHLILDRVDANLPVINDTLAWVGPTFSGLAVAGTHGPWFDVVVEGLGPIEPRPHPERSSRPSSAGRRGGDRMRRLMASVTPSMVAASMLGGCGVLGGGGGGYHITAEFERAVGLYEQSTVKVMGADAGMVDAVEVDGDLVRVEMTINDDVPLPADVRGHHRPAHPHRRAQRGAVAAMAPGRRAPRGRRRAPLQPRPRGSARR